MRAAYGAKPRAIVSQHTNQPRNTAFGTVNQRWLVKFGQVDKWNFCLRAARMQRIRRDHDKTSTPTHPPAFKAQGGAGRHQGGENASRAAQQYNVHPNQITPGRRRLWKVSLGCSDLARWASRAAPAVDVKVLHAKLGELMLEVDFWPVRSARPAC
jgi:transposase